jgi:aspartyl-tRNA(Asn)/glutamyl-tRNA(Gln) amidotransferase subunit C
MDDTSLLRIAKLARLRLNASDLEKLPGEFAHIISMIDKLSEVDTNDLDLSAELGTTQMPMQQDIVQDGGKVEAIMANAPDQLYNMFAVPKVIE